MIHTPRNPLTSSYLSTICKEFGNSLHDLETRSDACNFVRKHVWELIPITIRSRVFNFEIYRMTNVHKGIYSNIDNDAASPIARPILTYIRPVSHALSSIV
jgi:hypothetical protein